MTSNHALSPIGLAMAIVICLPAIASAQRVDVTKLSCQQARQVIAERGAAVVTTGPRTYKRFVADRQFCDAGERHLHPAYTPTADERACRIGFTCEAWSLYFPSDD